jgi:hypothetical protein
MKTNEILNIVNKVRTAFGKRKIGRSNLAVGGIKMFGVGRLSFSLGSAGILFFKKQDATKAAKAMGTTVDGCFGPPEPWVADLPDRLVDHLDQKIAHEGG